MKHNFGGNGERLLARVWEELGIIDPQLLPDAGQQPLSVPTEIVYLEN